MTPRDQQAPADDSAFATDDPRATPPDDGGATGDGTPPPAPQGDGSDVTPPSSPETNTAGGVISGDDAQRQLDEQRDRYLRLAAEFDNHKRRTAKQAQEAGSRAQADLVRHLIDAIDDLARFAHVDPGTTDATTVVQGVEMVEKKLLKTLSGAGLQVVDPVGEAFDPSRHEAVATEPTSNKAEDHVVARVYQRGYVFGGQLLRPARVVVKQYNG
ncbi:Protein grpE [Gemmatirosa kalamazoonensis]|uniref:Protein GrpE n=1 Tax=Gemmatirosa kalamazoonensis TaxID=861299 RepID=W0RI18_9BACT|nr:nucleotide exchange factor GrpE [Gemmatirosa kalamazoonensis]AHG90426.1 Protein grpE [Gemmatirosa kalamazoonensis]